MTRSHKLELERVLHRNQDGKTSAGAFLNESVTRSYINESFLDSSSYHLAWLGLHLSQSERLFGGLANLKTTYERGLRILNADKDDANPAPATPQAQFAKVSISGSYQRPLTLFDQKISYVGSLNAQWSADTLYSTNQISIGGLSTVRGFHEETISGDIGGYVRNEFSLALPASGIEGIDKLFGTVSPFIAWDGGVIDKDSKDATEKGVVSGWALGFHTSNGFFPIDVTYAKPLNAPDFITKRGYELYLSAKMSF